MDVIHTENFNSKLFESQKIIALKYLEHINAKLQHNKNLNNLVGYRTGTEFESCNGLMIDDTFPFKYMGKSIAFQLNSNEGNINIELINDINYYVLYIRCDDDGEAKSQFLYEFYKNDKNFLDIVPQDILKAIED